MIGFPILAPFSVLNDQLLGGGAAQLEEYSDFLQSGGAIFTDPFGQVVVFVDLQRSKTIKHE